MALIGCGVFNKKYIYIIIIYAVAMILLSFDLFFIYTKLDKFDNPDRNNNVLLTLFINNFGQIFGFIPELVLKNYYFNSNERKSEGKSEEKSEIKRLLSIFKKEKENNNKSLAIEYIFNDYSDQIGFKDIIFIFSGAILLLIVDYIKIIIQIKNQEIGDQLILNEQYNFVILICIIIFAYLFYKMKFYKHQIYSVLIIILLGIGRYLIKMDFYYGFFEAVKLIIDLVLQVFAAIFESIVIIYSKGLMEFKFLSPYKVSYIFGLINSMIILIFLLVFSFIKKTGKTWFFSLYYDGYYYLDHLKSIKDYGYLLIPLFFASIFYGTLKLLLNYTISRFTVCHTFLLLQNKEITSNIFIEMIAKKKYIFGILIIISHIIEFLVTLVFLEIIELRCCGLDNDLQRNIKDRGELEVRKSIQFLKHDDENITGRIESNESFSEDEIIKNESNEKE